MGAASCGYLLATELPRTDRIGQLSLVFTTKPPKRKKASIGEVLAYSPGTKTLSFITAYGAWDGSSLFPTKKIINWPMTATRELAVRWNF